MNWRPTASPEAIKKRAQALAAIRRFFAERTVLEVETPLLGATTTPDRHIESISLQCNQRTYYLQTSPEFYMKRLLASYPHSIYQICKAFRDEESGQHHLSEFTLLEWYRIDYDYTQLMDEVSALVNLVLGTLPQDFTKISYRDAFLKWARIDPFDCNADTLLQCCKQHGISLHSNSHEKDMLLDLLLSHIVIPEFQKAGRVFLTDYPSSQAALAQVDCTQTPTIAKRFELFINGIEIANGWEELQNTKEQRQRFTDDIGYRTAHGLHAPPIDEPLLAALEQGLPPCSGVALGLDRLLMLAADTPTIHQTVTFHL